MTSDDRRRHPAARVAHRDGPDLVRPPRGVGVLAPRTPPGAQLVAPLIFASPSLIAPDWMPHLVRIRVYVPSAISFFSAASIGWAMPRVLRDREAVGREAVAFAQQLELPVRLLDLVRDDGRVGHPHFGAPAGHRQVDGVLAREAQHRHRLLAFFGARLALLFRFFLLGRALLDRHRLAAEVGDRVDGRVVGRLRVERDAGLEVGRRSRPFLAFLGVGERRGAEVVSAGLRCPG